VSGEKMLIGLAETFEKVVQLKFKQAARQLTYNHNILRFIKLESRKGKPTFLITVEMPISYNELIEGGKESKKNITEQFRIEATLDQLKELNAELTKKIKAWEKKNGRN
jgi:hypothetical protein